MKTLDNYIIEKLKLNKNTVEELDIPSIMSQYKVGDICLDIIMYIDKKTPQKILLNLCKITKVDGDVLAAKGIKINKNDGDDLIIRLTVNQYHKSKNFKYVNTAGKGGATLVLPHDESLKILNEIKANKELNFYKLVYTDYNEWEETPIMERQYNSKGYYTGVSKISDETLKIIEDKLKGVN